MATNIQMNIKNSSGNYDILYPQTTASQIASGTLADARVPSLAASKITSGTFDTARIPSLAASKITEGTFNGTKTGEYIFPGNVRIGGTGSSSNAKLRIGDGEYVYFHEYSDDCLDIYAKTAINLKTSSNTGTITLNGKNINDLGGNSGTVTISSGGTGATTASSAIYNLTQPLSTRSSSNINSYASSTYIPCYYSSTGYKFPISNLLTYIQNNISSGGGTEVKAISYTGTGSEKTINLSSYSSKSFIGVSAAFYTTTGTLSGTLSTTNPVNIFPASWMPTSLTSNSKYSLCVDNRNINVVNSNMGYVFALSGSTLTIGTQLCRNGVTHTLFCFFN